MLRLAAIADGAVLGSATPSTSARSWFPPWPRAARRREDPPQGFDIVAAVPSAVTGEPAQAKAQLRSELIPLSPPFIRQHQIQLSGFADDIAAFDRDGRRRTPPTSSSRPRPRHRHSGGGRRHRGRPATPTAARPRPASAASRGRTSHHAGALARLASSASQKLTFLSERGEADSKHQLERSTAAPPDRSSASPCSEKTLSRSSRPACQCFERGLSSSRRQTPLMQGEVVPLSAQPGARWRRPPPRRRCRGRRGTRRKRACPRPTRPRRPRSRRARASRCRRGARSRGQLLPQLVLRLGGLAGHGGWHRGDDVEPVQPLAGPLAALGHRRDHVVADVSGLESHRITPSAISPAKLEHPRDRPAR